MYLDELFMKDNGPLVELPMKIQFRPDGLPMPTSTVSQNGCGTTTLLCVIGDALIHAASTAFGDDVTPFAGTGKSYLRLVKGRLVTYGQSCAFSALKFKDQTEEWFYTDTVEFSRRKTPGIASQSH